MQPVGYDAAKHTIYCLLFLILQVGKVLLFCLVLVRILSIWCFIVFYR